MKILHLTLCLVRVKAFPENIPFSGNAIFRKGKCFHVFGCISKNFPKNIFWCLENATRKKTKLEKQTQHPDWRSRSTGFDGTLQSDDRAINRDLAKHRAVEPSQASSVNLGFVHIFLGLSFPSSFPNTRKYFSENLWKCNQTHENIFLSEK